jgi:putative ATPase
MTDLFEQEQVTRPAADRPLPDRLRPEKLEEIVSQDHLVGPGAPIRRMTDSGRLVSMILWGPPGCGKTTLARILSTQTDLHFEQLSAVFSGVQDLRKAFESARVRQRNGPGTLLFVDEIHRFNKSQQDAFLPVVEDGTILLIGATTENPSFELNAALLSRTQVFVLRRLDGEALESLLARAEQDAGRKLPVDDEARAMLIAMADGDGRYVLSVAEQILSQDQTLDSEGLLKLIQRRAPLYDKADDAHYNLISALHKSVRGSDADAALYWLARMLAGGEQPEFIARRMTRMAVEDIGLADPQALPTCIAAWEAFERLGTPEGELALAQAVIYLATAPKSNAAYAAYGAARRAARDTGSLMPPKAILNAPTRLMKDEGYGEGYEYDHETAECFSGQDYFPDEMTRVTFYDPPDRGFEREIRKRLEYWQRLRDKRR